jgi:hypothetical protein
MQEYIVQKTSTGQRYIARCVTVSPPYTRVQPSELALLTDDQFNSMVNNEHANRQFLIVTIYQQFTFNYINIWNSLIEETPKDSVPIIEFTLKTNIPEFLKIFIEFYYNFKLKGRKYKLTYTKKKEPTIQWEGNIKDDTTTRLDPDNIIFQYNVKATSILRGLYNYLPGYSENIKLSNEELKDVILLINIR